MPRYDVTIRRIRVQDYTLNGVEAASMVEAELLALGAKMTDNDWETSKMTDTVVAVKGLTRQVAP